MLYFVIRKKHNATGWDNSVLVADSLDDAMHLYHAYLSTYAYGQSTSLDYISAEVETEDGRFIKSEIDDRRSGAEEA